MQKCMKTDFILRSLLLQQLSISHVFLILQEIQILYYTLISLKKLVKECNFRVKLQKK